MTNERLEQLKQRTKRAEALSGEIESLIKNQYEADSQKLPYLLRGEVYRLGREAALKAKEAELESLLKDPEPKEVIVPERQQDMSWQTSLAEAVAQ